MDDALPHGGGAAMRGKRRCLVQMRLLVAFLLLGSVGSFILGQEIARAAAVVPAYAAQALTFSGAGITASLSIPIQASGAIGQPTPTKPPSKVKSASKPAGTAPAKPTAKTPSAKGPSSSQPPIVVPSGAPPSSDASAGSTPSCNGAKCDSGVKKLKSPGAAAGAADDAAGGVSVAPTSSCSPGRSDAQSQSAAPAASPHKCHSARAAVDSSIASPPVIAGSDTPVDAGANHGAQAPTHAATVPAVGAVSPAPVVIATPASPDVAAPPVIPAPAIAPPLTSPVVSTLDPAPGATDARPSATPVDPTLATAPAPSDAPAGAQPLTAGSEKPPSQETSQGSQSGEGSQDER